MRTKVMGLASAYQLAERLGDGSPSLAVRRSREANNHGVCLMATSVGEPDAANPHARFDERDVKTEHGPASEAPATERTGNG